MLKLLVKKFEEMPHYWMVFVIAILCVSLSFIFKLVTISDNSVQFWYDQARDATLSREILLNYDLKLQGPSASGTNDTLYHGVWYYYLIAPWYVLGGGNPIMPTVFMAFVTSIAVGILVWLTYEISKSLKVSLLAGLLAAFSLEVSELGVYLANPTMAIPGLVLLYLSIWSIFYQRNVTYKWVVLLGFSLGWCTQAAIWLIYLWGPVIVGCIWYVLKSKHSAFNLILVNWKKIIVLVGIYFICISSMLLAQLKLWNSGIFTIGELSEATQEHQSSLSTHLPVIVRLYENKIEHTVLLGSASSLLVIALYFFVARKYDTKTNVFLISLWSSPLWLILWHGRSTYHILLGLELVVIFLIAHIAILLPKKLNFLIPVLFCLWVVLQGTTLSSHRTQRITTFSPSGAPFLRDQLALLDTAFDKTNPCSYSTLAVPFAYNTTWSYLFDWQERVNSKTSPVYVGSNQSGIAGASLIQSSSIACNDHLSIVEAHAPLDEYFFKAYENDQNTLGPVVVSKFEFPGLKLEIRAVLKNQ